jgi:drug/metabolite transporter (DMT)-like permease
MANAAAVDWVDQMPQRWARNGAIFGLIWVVLSVVIYGWDRGLLSAALVLGVFICLLSLLGWLCGLAARRRLRRLVALDDTSADRALTWLPGRYVLVGALLGMFFMPADLVLRWRTGELATTFEDLIVPVVVFPIAGALVGGFVGLITSDQIRKRLASSGN